MGNTLPAPLTTKKSEQGDFGDGHYYCASDMQGWRLNMEDAHIISSNLAPRTHFVGVFDGHGGCEVAKFCAARFANKLVELEAFKEKNFDTALKQCFHLMDDCLRDPAYHQEVVNYRAEAIEQQFNVISDIIIDKRTNRFTLTQMQDILNIANFFAVPLTIRPKLIEALESLYEENNTNENVANAQPAPGMSNQETFPDDNDKSEGFLGVDDGNAGDKGPPSEPKRPKKPKFGFGPSKIKRNNESKASRKEGSQQKQNSPTKHTPGKISAKGIQLASETEIDKEFGFQRSDSSNSKEKSFKALEDGPPLKATVPPTAPPRTQKSRKNRTETDPKTDDSNPAATTNVFISPHSDDKHVSGKVLQEESDSVDDEERSRRSTSVIELVAEEKKEVLPTTELVPKIRSSMRFNKKRTSVNLEGTNIQRAAEDAPIIAAAPTANVPDLTINKSTDDDTWEGLADDDDSEPLGLKPPPGMVDDSKSLVAPPGMIKPAAKAETIRKRVGKKRKSRRKVSSSNNNDDKDDDNPPTDDDKKAQIRKEVKEANAGAHPAATGIKKTKSMNDENEITLEEISINTSPKKSKGPAKKTTSEVLSRGAGTDSAPAPVPGTNPKDQSNIEGPLFITGAGCTAVSALFHEDKIYVANIGDSRAVLCRSGQSFALSEDHKPQMPKERARIQAAGGTINQQGRINGDLNLSRCVGDLRFKTRKDLSPAEQIVTAEADVKLFQLKETDLFVVLACDGVWDVMSNQQVCDFVLKQFRDGETNPTAVTEALLDKCLSPDLLMTKGLGGDNMTCILILLKPVEEICKFKPKKMFKNVRRLFMSGNDNRV